MEAQIEDLCWEDREESMMVEVEFEIPSPNGQLYQYQMCSSPTPLSPLWNFSGDNSESAAENIRNDDVEKTSLGKPYLGLGVLDNFNVCFIIKERVIQALRYFKETTQQQILAQIWAPVRSGNRYVLITSGQPFILDPDSNGLNQYRTVSLMYMFALGDDIDETLGLPGRVFRTKLPEWTPNVQYYTVKEYPLVHHVRHYNVKGCLALPMFEPSRQSCIGVLELIMTSQKIKYAPEVEQLCRALEAADLRSSEILDHRNIQICNEGCQNALPESLELLRMVCETYKLPLAQTWLPCRHRSVLTHCCLKRSCSCSMQRECLSTSNVASYVLDAHLLGFREACAEHHLQKGQGMPGRAILSQGLCFCRDISRFSKVEYPLVHYARLFGLTASFAVCLRSKYTGDDYYVLEFFLSPSITDNAQQHNLLDSILTMISQDFQSFTVASGRALEEEMEHMEIIGVSMDEIPTSEVNTPLSIVVTSNEDAIATCDGIKLSSGSIHQASENRPKDKTLQCEDGLRLLSDELVRSKACSDDDGKFCDAGNDLHVLQNGQTERNSKKKNVTVEKQISAEDILPLLSLKLVDAAKRLGVSKSTLKRKCRKNGIEQWPSNRRRARNTIELKCTDVSGSGSKPLQPNLSAVAECVDASNQCISLNCSPFEGQQMIRSPPDMRLATDGEATKTTQSQKYPDGGLGEAGSSVRPDVSSSTVVVKATYKDDIIRLNMMTSSFDLLKEEVGKRLNIDMGKFKIKYQDDDNDWVLMACDSDLQHSLCVSRLSGGKILRLLIHDIVSS